MVAKTQATALIMKLDYNMKNAPCPHYYSDSKEPSVMFLSFYQYIMLQAKLGIIKRGVLMLEKILTKGFRRTLQMTFNDIQNQQDRRDEEEFAKDELRIKEKLLTAIKPYPVDVVLEEDFMITAVDGSGSANLTTLDDIRVHLLSTSVIALYTNTKQGPIFEPVDRESVENQIGEQPNLNSHWHSGVRGDAKKKLAESLTHIYPLKDVSSIILPFFQDYTRGKIGTKQEIGKSVEYSKYVKMLKAMETLISREQMLTNPVVHDELRSVSEYAAARRVLESEMRPKYLLLDGALSVFMHFVKKFPSMPSGFMLRDLCSLAREKGVIICAVSKNHTIPFAHRIARMAQDIFGKSTKWFCQLPSKEDVGGGLHITQDRTYIPPQLAVPYLYSFAVDNRPSRIDFDRIWWQENIFVEGDPSATRENEKVMFQEIEFMSRDARWYGYPVALALAHESCKLGWDDLRLAKEICYDVRKEMGLDERRMDSLRTDYNL